MNVPFIVRKLFGSVTWRMPGTDPVLFITFDDGPVPEVTPLVLDILRSFSVKATFFCTGENVQKHRDVYEKILADGHSTGNHTFHHLNGWKSRRNQYVADVELCAAVMKKPAVGSRRQAVATGLPSPNSELPSPDLFRPPYGKLSLSQYSMLKSHYSIVMWDVLSKDYDEKISGEQCFRNVRSSARNGSVIVFHDSVKAKERVLYALPKVLEYFSEQKFSFKTIG